MKKQFVIYFGVCVISTAFCTLLKAQQYANHWYFGDSAAIDFTTGAPVSHTLSQMKSYEGCASISDNNGNLLFYTNGKKIWNKNHQVMPNGTGLKGGWSSTQSVLIVPHVGNANLYYVFTTDESRNTAGLCYSIVDISLASNLGDVTVKNSPLVTPVAEKVTAMRACNGKDIWVVTHEWDTDAFYAYLISSTGLQATPVISHAGPVHSTANNWMGAIKISPVGNKLALAGHSTSLELYDFNSATGVVSNYIGFPSAYNGAYGIEFSPDGSKLYASIFSLASPAIYQFDLLAGSVSAIIASATLLTTRVPGLVEFFGTLQLGPDKKIYVSKVGEQHLSVINNPDAAGLACNYTSNAVSLGKTCEWGLPNLFYDFSPKPSLTKTNVTCNAGANGAAAIQINSVFPYYYSWQPSGSTSASVSNTAAGTHTVSYTDGYGCIKDTFVTLTQPLPLTMLFTAPADICEGQSVTTSVSASGGTPSYSYNWEPGNLNTPSVTLSPITTTNYTVTVSDMNGCSAPSGQFIITVYPNPVVSISSDANITRGQTVQLTASGGVTFQWINPAGLSCSNCYNPVASPMVSATYSVLVSNQYGCSNMAITAVNVDDVLCGNLFLPNAFSPNNDGANDVFLLYGAECYTTFHMEIYNRWGEKIFSSNNLSIGWSGTIDNTPAPQDAYVWRLMAVDMNGNEIKSSGHVSLIR